MGPCGDTDPIADFGRPTPAPSRCNPNHGMSQSACRFQAWTSRGLTAAARRVPGFSRFCEPHGGPTRAARRQAARSTRVGALDAHLRLLARTAAAAPFVPKGSRQISVQEREVRLQGFCEWKLTHLLHRRIESCLALEPLAPPRKTNTTWWISLLSMHSS